MGIGASCRVSPSVIILQFLNSIFELYSNILVLFIHAQVVCDTSHSGSVVDQPEHEFFTGITRDTMR
jgi:hypothetical protein